MPLGYGLEMTFLGRFLHIGFVISTAFFVGQSQAIAVTAEPIPGQYIVKVKKGVSFELSSQTLKNKVTFRKILNGNSQLTLNGIDNWARVYVIHDSTNSQTLSEIAQSIGAENIEYIEPVYPLEFFGLPDDSLFGHQWHLHNTGQEYIGIKRIEGDENDSLVLKLGTSGKDINLVPFYESPPSESVKVVVGIIDTGVDIDHPELVERIWHNPDETANNGVDDDHNGFVDDIVGYDVSGDEFSFFDPIGDSDPSDSIGHGTHIAGIVAANANGKGVVGVAPWAEIMAIKIQPNATTAVGAAGIIYAVIAGAKVINISWGSPFEAAILRDALEFARANGVFVAIAAGNSGDNQRFYPAAFDSAFVVAAGNSNGFMTDFSTFGAHIDVVAPGEDILSLRARGTDMYGEVGEPGVRIIGSDSLYYLSDGTSMSTPVVVGEAALLWGFRPDLSLNQIEDIIRMGAVDLIDPRDSGDVLIGPDTLSGYGYISVASSYELLVNGGLRFLSPIPRNRYTGDVDVKILPVAGYNGSWRIEYKFSESNNDWQSLDEGIISTGDTISLTFSSAETSGNLQFRLVDQFGGGNSLTVVYVRNKVVDITYPLNNQEVKYTTPIIGSVYGAGFDSMLVLSKKQGAGLTYLTSSSGEYFDSLLVNWSVSGLDTGNFTIYLYGYFDTGVTKDSVKVHISSAFAAGWPRSFNGFAALSPASGDIDGDGKKELIVGTSNGLNAFRFDGTTLPGFPVLKGKDVRCVPAIYDIDYDNRPDIICTTEDTIHAIKYNGQYVSGWPKNYYTGTIPFGFGYPNPTIAPLGNGTDSVIMLLNKRGQILAYNFDGTPYFYSLGGLFASFDPRITDFLSYGGQSSPMVTSFDLDNDGLFEIIGSYSAFVFPYEGIGLFESTTGR
ncbi:MAG TPA: S8 family serine peptidase, partial [candidate division Zixibacteria bacterium]|nr:S8 family serine peptidase [candidate division Zixibacteria bacterium]